MSLAELNTHFDARRIMTTGQYELLVQSGRVFKTEAQFSPAQALTYLWPMPEEEVEAQKRELMKYAGMSQETADAIYELGGQYGGYIFTQTGTIEEAEKWANIREMGETVIGQIGGSIPLNASRSQALAQLN